MWRELGRAGPHLRKMQVVSQRSESGTEGQVGGGISGKDTEPRKGRGCSGSSTQTGNWAILSVHWGEMEGNFFPFSGLELQPSHFSECTVLRSHEVQAPS